MKINPDGSITLKSGTVDPPVTYPDGSVVMPRVSLQGSDRTVRRFAPVVFKDGRVAEEAVDHPNLSGLRWARVIDGQVMLTRRARTAGAVFYRDMCMGKIAGVEADPAKWELYESVMTLRGQGKVPRRGTLPPETLYHAECIRRTEDNAGGLERMGDDEIKRLLEAAGERGAEVELEMETAAANV